MTKKQMELVERYNSAEHASVWSCYGKPSWNKVGAEREILDEMNANDGWGYRVTSYNTFHFSCAYKYMKDGMETLVYHTSANRWEIPLH